MWDNHFLLCVFINTTINASNAMMSIPKLIIKDRASVTVIIKKDKHKMKCLKPSKFYMFSVKMFFYGVVSTGRRTEISLFRLCNRLLLKREGEHLS